VVIDNEIIQVGTRSGNTFDGLQRGTKGTTAAAHSNGAAVLTDGVHFHFQGPDFDSLIDRFKNLDFASILQAIRSILDFIKTIDGPDSHGIAKVLDTKLPLVDRSVSEIIDIASNLADKIDAIAANPAGAIQQLSNLLAGALGKTVPTTSSTTTTEGNSSTHEVQQFSLTDATAGTFRLTFGREKTTPLPYNASDAQVK